MPPGSEGLMTVSPALSSRSSRTRGAGSRGEPTGGTVRRSSKQGPRPKHTCPPLSPLSPRPRTSQTTWAPLAALLPAGLTPAVARGTCKCAPTPGPPGGRCWARGWMQTGVLFKQHCRPTGLHLGAAGVLWGGHLTGSPHAWALPPPAPSWDPPPKDSNSWDCSFWAIGVPTSMHPKSRASSLDCLRPDQVASEAAEGGGGLDGGAQEEGGGACHLHTLPVQGALVTL